MQLHEDEEEEIFFSGFCGWFYGLPIAQLLFDQQTPFNYHLNDEKTLNLHLACSCDCR